MGSTTEIEEGQVSLNLSNFPSWYRHLSLARPEAVEEVRRDLSQVIEGFSNLKLVPSGEAVYTLKAAIRVDDPSRKASAEYSFDEISHGQRILITLYTLLHAGLDSPDAIVCIDEPDNFVALSEIQPWLTKAVEMAETSKSQLLLVSHHPEVLNQLARDHGLIFTRSNGGPTRIAKFEADKNSALTPSEVIARGWEK
jgi:predicted ATPase